MEKKIRAILLKLFGLQKYLSLVSDAYIRLIRAGFLRKKYPEIAISMTKPIGQHPGIEELFLDLLK